MKENCTILWAEDDQDDVDMILDAARELHINHLIDFVATGKDALDKLFRSIPKKQLPQLIVLDINMPVLNGFQTLSEIIKYPVLREIPVAFFTTGRFDPDIYSIQNNVHIFHKPASYASFVKTLKTILDLCKLPSEIL